VAPPLIVPESHTPVSLVLVCGMGASLLVQTTVVPADTVSTAGENCRLAMVTVAPPVADWFDGVPPPDGTGVFVAGMADGTGVAVGVLDGAEGGTPVVVAMGATGVAVGVLVGGDGTTTIVPCMNGWTLQW
jgi:hypothetical protein